jgi:glutathione peroxidase
VETHRAAAGVQRRRRALEKAHGDGGVELAKDLQRIDRPHRPGQRAFGRERADIDRVGAAVGGHDLVDRTGMVGVGDDEIGRGHVIDLHVGRHARAGKAQVRREGLALEVAKADQQHPLHGHGVGGGHRRVERAHTAMFPARWGAVNARRPPRAHSTPRTARIRDLVRSDFLPGQRLRKLKPMTPSSLFEFSSKSINGKSADFAARRNHVFLIVNTASACGFTPQFKGLEALWQDLRDRGLVVVGYPCNQFGAQDPGSNGEIASFCEMNYGVSFPMMAKVDVNGAGADPLWNWLKAEAPGMLGSEAIKWNFTKFLVGRDGKVIKRYAPNDEPEKLRADIEKALAA